MKKLKELSLFFPAYNEEANLKNTVDKAIPILQSVAEKYEILIVNDGSKDKTGEVAEKLAKQYPFIRVINHNPNRGYGAAFKSGFYNAKYEWVTFIDADGQFDFAEITKFIDKQRETNADLVIGYYIKRAVPFTVILTSKIWEMMVFVLFGVRATDIDTGFKMVRRSIFDNIPQLQAERGPFITSEFLIRCKQAGYKKEEVGVHHYPRGGGKPTGRNWKVIFNGFKDLLRLRFNPNDFAIKKV